MKTSRTLKLASLCLIAVATFVTMSRVFPSPLRSAPLTALEGPVGIDRPVSDTVLASAGVADPTSRQSISRSTMNTIDISYDNGAIHVAALGTISDTRPGFSFCWGLRVFEADNPDFVVVDELYDQQSTPLEQDVTYKPHLLTSVPFEGLAGDFRVELALYHIPNGMAPAAPEYQRAVMFGKGATGGTTIHVD